MADVVTLTLDGQRYEGWTGVRISRAIDTLSGSFDLSLTDRERIGSTRLKLRAGSACTVSIDGETLITGWLDRISMDIDAQGHRLSVAGRDKSADLIDCAAIATPGSWTNVKLEAIAQQLAKPFGITVTAAASTGANIRKFALQQGETVFQAIERLCRFRGLLAVSTSDGNVELITPGTGSAVAQIVEGVNAKSLSGTHDVSERFSEYVVKGQSSGDDEVNGKAASAPSGKATDPAITRYRPLMIIGEEQADHGSLAKRAQWEATTRAAAAQEANITVVGWRIREGGPLWDRNTIATVASPSLYMDAPMLIAGVDLVKDADNGATAQLRLSPPEAFSQLAIPEEAEASAVGKRK